MRAIVDGSFTGEYRDEELTILRPGAFQGCTGLTSVELPAATSIGNNAFQGCTGLTSVELPALVGNTPDGRCVASFANCASLRRLDLPSFSWLGGNETFSGCTALEYLRLGKSTDFSGWKMFYGLVSLRTVDFGSLRSLRTDFHDSTLLDTFIIRTANYVCTTTSANNIPSGCPIANGTGYIYVPRDLVDKYKAATNWSVYADQFRAIEDYPDICDPD